MSDAVPPPPSKIGSLEAPTAALGNSEDGDGKTQNINVAVRVRPLHESEKKSFSNAWRIDGNAIHQVLPGVQKGAVEAALRKASAERPPKAAAGGLGSRATASKGEEPFEPLTFTFETILGADITNADLYDQMATRMIKKTVFTGINGCFLTYGPTGSGKTHSIMGNHDDPGILPRAIDEIFASIESSTESETKDKTQETHEFSVRFSYLEIYKEMVTDLLQDPPENQNLAVKEDPGKGFFVQGVLERLISGAQEALVLIGEGESKRRYAATDFNERSSRSHVVCTFIVEKTTTKVTRTSPRGSPATSPPLRRSSSLNLDKAKGEDVPSSKSEREFVAETKTTCVGRLHVVDLAGCEPAGHLKGDRLEEGKLINKSLFFLSECISRLVKAQRKEDKAEREAAAAAAAASAAPALKVPPSPLPKGPGRSSAPTVTAGTIQEKAGAVSHTHIPYRDSKLTRLLANSLGGNSHTVLLVTLNPTENHVDQAIQALRFAARAKMIKNRIEENFISPEQSVIHRQNELIKQLQAQLRDLESKLKDTGPGRGDLLVITKPRVVLPDTEKRGEVDPVLYAMRRQSLVPPGGLARGKSGVSEVSAITEDNEEEEEDEGTQMINEIQDKLEMFQKMIFRSQSKREKEAEEEAKYNRVRRATEAAPLALARGFNKLDIPPEATQARRSSAMPGTISLQLASALRSPDGRKGSLKVSWQDTVQEEDDGSELASSWESMKERRKQAGKRPVEKIDMATSTSHLSLTIPEAQAAPSDLDRVSRRLEKVDVVLEYIVSYLDRKKKGPDNEAVGEGVDRSATMKLEADLAKTEKEEENPEEEEEEEQGQDGMSRLALAVDKVEGRMSGLKGGIRGMIDRSKAEKMRCVEKEKELESKKERLEQSYEEKVKSIQGATEELQDRLKASRDAEYESLQKVEDLETVTVAQEKDIERLQQELIEATEKAEAKDAEVERAIAAAESEKEALKADEARLKAQNAHLIYEKVTLETKLEELQKQMEDCEKQYEQKLDNFKDQARKFQEQAKAQMRRLSMNTRGLVGHGMRLADRNARRLSAASMPIPETRDEAELEEPPARSASVGETSGRLVPKGSTDVLMSRGTVAVSDFGCQFGDENEIDHQGMQTETKELTSSEMQARVEGRDSGALQTEPIEAIEQAIQSEKLMGLTDQMTQSAPEIKDQMEQAALETQEAGSQHIAHALLEGSVQTAVSFSGAGFIEGTVQTEGAVLQDSDMHMASVPPSERLEAAMQTDNTEGSHAESQTDALENLLVFNSTQTETRETRDQEGQIEAPVYQDQSSRWEGGSQMDTAVQTSIGEGILANDKATQALQNTDVAEAQTESPLITGAAASIGNQTDEKKTDSRISQTDALPVQHAMNQTDVSHLRCPATPRATQTVINCDHAACQTDAAGLAEPQTTAMQTDKSALGTSGVQTHTAALLEASTSHTDLLGSSHAMNQTEAALTRVPEKEQQTQVEVATRGGESHTAESLLTKRQSHSFSQTDLSLVKVVPEDKHTQTMARTEKTATQTDETRIDPKQKGKGVQTQAVVVEAKRSQTDPPPLEDVRSQTELSLVRHTTRDSSSQSPQMPPLPPPTSRRDSSGQTIESPRRASPSQTEDTPRRASVTQTDRAASRERDIQTEPRQCRSVASGEPSPTEVRVRSTQTDSGVPSPSPRSEGGMACPHWHGPMVPPSSSLITPRPTDPFQPFLPQQQQHAVEQQQQQQQQQYLQQPQQLQTDGGEMRRATYLVGDGPVQPECRGSGYIVIQASDRSPSAPPPAPPPSLHITNTVTSASPARDPSVGGSAVGSPEDKRIIVTRSSTRQAHDDPVAHVPRNREREERDERHVERERDGEMAEMIRLLRRVLEGNMPAEAVPGALASIRGGGGVAGQGVPALGSRGPECGAPSLRCRYVTRGAAGGADDRQLQNELDQLRRMLADLTDKSRAIISSRDLSVRPHKREAHEAKDCYHQPAPSSRPPLLGGGPVIHCPAVGRIPDTHKIGPRGTGGGGGAQINILGGGLRGRGMAAESGQGVDDQFLFFVSTPATSPRRAGVDSRRHETMQEKLVPQSARQERDKRPFYYRW
ncbi:unnamed protein product [Vitrella brassicaformis CCMP3155]|uniref:Kinesin motor domain-containing protein n=5 Tax=Vitrella brassicaformis TaxID=1169539 RepID=A0A0G4E8I5_VITBC|nr:unnamed protein product [Vitrella brassicaformis CCMP3155]|eukprot:CEL91648.1 unnamed protein product [Vitrella brassicaformis CCMP3155]